PTTVRILGERLAARPSRRTNLAAALDLVTALSGRLGLTLDQFDSVRQVFLDEEPQSDFALWFSMVYRPDSTRELKVYLNPDARGREQAPQLVPTALSKLGLTEAYATTLAHAVRPGRLNTGDRFSFFALDLHDRPHARVKLYVAHEGADSDDLARAAGAVP